LRTNDTDTGTGARRRRRRVAGGAAVLVVVASAGFVLLDGDSADPVPTEAAAADTGVADAAETADQRRTQEDAEERAERQRRAAAEAEEAAEAERLAAEEAAAAEAAAAARQAEEDAEAERLAAEEAAAAEAAEAAAEAERQAAAEQQEFVDAQQRLIDLGYLVGAADGELGQQTSSALMAFQAVQGLSVDGQLGPQTAAALAGSPVEPTLRGGPANRIEVDMDRQVMHLVEGGQRVTTMKVSTGRGGTFESPDGQTLEADTPVGTFTIDRRIAGEKPSSYGIGSLWDPMYFHGPWAIHGSPDVPAGPASSGCVRLAMANGRWLFDRVPNGTHVVLYGGTHVFTP
jgi:lipoprotein-anchoring transpeptidase ErfK/SrfK